jgi:hypothetical protein
MDDFKPHAELVVILVIGLRAANYIKLVSQGHVPFSSTRRNMEFLMIELIATISGSMELY